MIAIIAEQQKANPLKISRLLYNLHVCFITLQSIHSVF